ncbi:MAG: hypothetical protein LUQ34_02070, partial [Euryarchaeota archaeon]|nr:hypothetical protein [Euryarchaeota archaeon]
HDAPLRGLKVSRSLNTYNAVPSIDFNHITGLAEDRNTFIPTSTIAVRGSIRSIETERIWA